MTNTLVRHATARRLWALPGAMLNTLRAPQFSGGMVQETESSPLISMPCPSFLIEHPRGMVLFDTGVSPKGLREPERYIPDLARRFKMTTGEDLAVDSQLGGLGLSLDKVRYVIASHLHFDHAGGVYLFPGSTLLVGAGEWAHAFSPRPTGHHMELLHDLVPTLRFNWIELPGDHDLFGDGSVVILRTPGHTPGELSLMVRLPNRTIILTGDTCHYRVELQHGLPARGYCVDMNQGTQSIRRLQMLRDAYEATVWIGHDVEDWAAMPHAPQQID